MEEARKIWSRCDAVCFDVDSTVVMEEGLDELAKFMGKGEEIAALTLKAMGGQTTFRESLETRLNILRPSLTIIQKFAELGNLSFTKGLVELIGLLQSKGVEVYLVSGGFQTFIKPLATKLGIPHSHVYANDLHFRDDGSYAGFDVNQPTSASGGKPKVVQILKDSKGYKNVVFVGDGATDAEASPPAELFIGFGGNVVREAVKSRAKWYVYDFQELIRGLDNHQL